MSKLKEVLEITDELRGRFKQDNFAERRNSGTHAGVAFDPESFLLGWEEERGRGYGKHRVFTSIEAWKDTIAGLIPPVFLPLIAPRVDIAQYIGDVGTICVEELQALVEDDSEACLLPIKWLLEEARKSAKAYVDQLSEADAKRGLEIVAKYSK